MCSSERLSRQDAPDEERIFDPKRTGRKRRQLMACFQAAVQAAGLSDFHFHDLRHTFATRLRAANVHPYDIADLLGIAPPAPPCRKAISSDWEDNADLKTGGKKIWHLTMPTLRQVYQEKQDEMKKSCSDFAYIIIK